MSVPRRAGSRDLANIATGTRRAHRPIVMKLIAVTVVSICALAGTADAQPRSVDGEVDEGAAVLLSIGGTFVGVAALSVADFRDQSSLWIASGIALAMPSAGHWYCGAHVTRGMVTRVVGFGLMAAGFSQLDDGGTEGIILLGLGTMVAGTIDDIVTAPRRARRRNAELRGGLAIAPSASRDGAGVVMSGRF
jgi:hypothetical protein